MIIPILKGTPSVTTYKNNFLGISKNKITVTVRVF